jgi:hypothetical protein
VVRARDDEITSPPLTVGRLSSTSGSTSDASASGVGGRVAVADGGAVVTGAGSGTVAAGSVVDGPVAPSATTAAALADDGADDDDGPDDDGGTASVHPPARARPATAMVRRPERSGRVSDDVSERRRRSRAA